LSAGILRPSELFDHRTIRWVLAAHNICFKTKFYATFFSYGKSIPIVRGDGVYQVLLIHPSMIIYQPFSLRCDYGMLSLQQGMQFCLARLNQGQWAHIYPEGKVNVDPSEPLLPLKWGTARLIDDCEKTPVVVPMYHLGNA
jgi:monolysocardiolipin acyltransferase